MISLRDLIVSNIPPCPLHSAGAEQSDNKLGPSKIRDIMAGDRQLIAFYTHFSIIIMRLWHAAENEGEAFKFLLPQLP